MPHSQDHSGVTDETEDLPDWSAYQEEVADFFRSLALAARTNVKIDGARGIHDVDVLVEFTSAGIPITWVVECKAWKRAIPKERVLVLAGVVEDVGADRGLIVAESGFQGGAVRVAQHSNVTLTSLDDLRANTEVERAQSEVSGFAGRISGLHDDSRRIWDWAPPSTPGGSIQVDRMVEFGADVFELHSMVLPRIASNSYPITLVLGEQLVADDAAQLKPALVRRIESVTAEADALWVLARSTADRASALLEVFEANLEELLAAGRGMDADPEAEVARFVAAMRAVSDSADSLKATVPAQVRGNLMALMRWLIDHTYVVTVDSRPDWAAEEARLDGFLASIRASLSGAIDRNRPVDS